jgi:hypothetical protein
MENDHATISTPASLSCICQSHSRQCNSLDGPSGSEPNSITVSIPPEFGGSAPGLIPEDLYACAHKTPFQFHLFFTYPNRLFCTLNNQILLNIEIFLNLFRSILELVNIEGVRVMQPIRNISSDRGGTHVRISAS